MFFVNFLKTYKNDIKSSVTLNRSEDTCIDRFGKFDKILISSVVISTKTDFTKIIMKKYNICLFRHHRKLDFLKKEVTHRRSIENANETKTSNGKKNTKNTNEIGNRNSLANPK